MCSGHTFDKFGRGLWRWTARRAWLELYSGGSMTREPELPEWLPPHGGPIRVGRRPRFRGYDPFYAF
jgi:hypothetical protein